jgi:hypothetical protein
MFGEFSTLFASSAHWSSTFYIAQKGSWALTLFDRALYLWKVECNELCQDPD